MDYTEGTLIGVTLGLMLFTPMHSSLFSLSAYAHIVTIRLFALNICDSLPFALAIEKADMKTTLDYLR